MHTDSYSLHFDLNNPFTPDMYDHPIPDAYTDGCEIFSGCDSHEVYGVDWLGDSRCFIAWREQHYNSEHTAVLFPVRDSTLSYSAEWYMMRQRACQYLYQLTADPMIPHTRQPVPADPKRHCAELVAAFTKPGALKLATHGDVADIVDQGDAVAAD